jgi:hypothetical protein
MYLTPIVIKTYKIKQSKIQFLNELRANTREPFFDNKNSRRMDSDDKRLFANEFDNYIFLKNEIFGYRWKTNKTLIHLKENNSGLKILTLSFPGGLGGLFYVGFGLSVFLFFGIKIFIEEGNINYLLFFIGLYILSVSNLNSDFKKQNDLVKEIVNKINNNHNTQ